MLSSQGRNSVQRIGVSSSTTAASLSKLLTLSYLAVASASCLSLLLPLTLSCQSALFGVC